MEDNSTIVEKITTELLNVLHDVNFVITPDEGKRLGFVIHHFLQQNSADQLREPAIRAHLVGMLGPIVCSSPAQQRDFPLYFERAFSRTVSTATTVNRFSPTNNSPSLGPEKTNNFLRAAVLIIITLAILTAVSSLPPVKNILQRLYPSVTPPDTLVVDDNLPRKTDTTSQAGVNQDVDPSAFKSIERMQEIPVTYTPDKIKLIVVAIVFGLLIGWLLYTIVYDTRRTRHTSKAPFALSFPIKEHEIQGSPNFDEWIRQLQQREEGNHRMLNVLGSIKTTISKGGFPQVVFKRTRKRPHYLMLLDNSSPLDQKTRLFAQVSRMLYQRGIDADLFYFNSSPDFCWNARYPAGIRIERLQQLFPSSYLLVNTDGVQLIDHTEGRVSSWVVKIFSDWSKRAILTPSSTDQWGFVEKVLATFFVVLPATSTGQFMVRPFLDNETFSFTRLKSFFGSNLSTPLPGLKSSLREIEVTEVESYLQAMAGREKVDPRFLPLLNCWAMATAVYNKPSFEITVAIGKALERKKKLNGLLTTNHLMIITSLPWLTQAIIPAELTEKLLFRLKQFDKSLTDEESIEQIAREAVLDLLNEATPEPGSRAEEEKKIGILEQHVSSNRRDHSTTVAIRKLRSFERAGLVIDKRTASRVRNHFNVGKWATASAGAITLVSLLSFVEAPTAPPSNKAEAFFMNTNGTIDSAAVYNNKAVAVAEREGNTTSNANVTQQKVASPDYDSMAIYLHKSWLNRKTPAAYKNACRVRYNMLLSNSNFQNVVSRPATMPEVPVIMAPLFGYRPEWIPERNELLEYLTYLYAFKGAASVQDINPDYQPTWYKRLVPEKTNGALRLASDSLTKTQVTLKGLSFDQSDLTDSLKDFIIQLSIDKIYFYYGGPKDPSPLIASTETVQPTRSARKRKVPANNSVRQQSTIIPNVSSYNEARADSIAAANSIRVADSTKAVNSKRVADSIQAINSNTKNRLSTTGAVHRDSLQETQTENTATGGTIQGDYGVVKGILRNISKSGNSLILDVISGNKDCKVIVEFARYNDLKRQENAIIKFGATPPPELKQMIQYAMGFQPLNKDEKSGAINYTRLQYVLQSGEDVSDAELYDYLMNYRGLLKSTVYIWGALNRTGKARDWEMRNVHMNQGSTESPFNGQNAPWQDGAIVFAIEGDTPKTLYVYFDSQVFNVDANGQPRKAQSLKKK